MSDPGPVELFSPARFGFFRFIFGRFAAKHLRTRAGKYELAIAAVDSKRRVTRIRVPLRLT